MKLTKTCQPDTERSATNYEGKNKQYNRKMDKRQGGATSEHKRATNEQAKAAKVREDYQPRKGKQTPTKTPDCAHQQC